MGSEVRSSAKMQPMAQMSGVAQQNTHANTEGRSRCCTRSQSQPLRATSVLLALTDGFGVVSSPKEQFRGPVPEGHYDRVKVGQRLQWRVKESGKTHVSCRKERCKQQGYHWREPESFRAAHLVMATVQVATTTISPTIAAVGGAVRVKHLPY